MNVRVRDPGTLVVSEVFGPTYQGEGPSLGQRAAFVRLGRCNLDCGSGPASTWACDTPYTWNWERFDRDVELRAVRTGDLIAAVAAMGVERVVVTGGEPLIQQRQLESFLLAARERGWAVEIETNGTIAPRREVVAAVERFNVSPKLTGSGVPPERALRAEALATLRDSGRAVFKFVVARPAELDEVAAVTAAHRLAPVWIMPAGTTAEAVLACARALADPVLDRGWNLTTRLHVLLWGDERGR
jgi:7-carboxy-7-deazaguanine synthase